MRSRERRGRATPKTRDRRCQGARQGTGRRPGHDVALDHHRRRGAQLHRDRRPDGAAHRGAHRRQVRRRRRPRPRCSWSPTPPTAADAASHATGHVRVQRRPWILERLAASRRARAAPGGDGRRRRAAAAAVRADRQRADPAQALRPGLHRPGLDRVLAGGQGREDQASSTGYSGDIESVGEVIRLWTTRNGRWMSPKYLCGESYGTTRAAALSRHLQERYGLYLNGLMLISCFLNGGSVVFTPGNDDPYVNYLPTYAAIAQLPRQARRPAACARCSTRREEYAAGDYPRVLAAGTRLDRARSGPRRSPGSPR